ncbi:2-keto-3-deoxy-L-rhamnonate aldolase RhmA [Rubricella aquisinus]|uniref:2-keto-3-deoxy-L-rhamnonate aldolase RhmA n=1 Tax=Rubricella aquisinus TaxID=2028108 RepID=A0A840WIA4_9RHOB|nr:aldolase/citrate lyase family protein [Rubricella aquisinus]MBB5514858.1 2-keto-3-deoxy-L-rhamnonate aldolase RhmA [Rubricella aquisinus]
MGDTKFGCWLDLPSPAVAEIIGLSGFDFTVIDLEHGPMSMETATLCMMALKSTPTMPIIRVTEGTEGQIKRALDSGAAGVMVPRVETAEQAERMVQYFRYPPRGVRGAAQSVIRAAGYGKHAEQYTAEETERHMLALQIESVEGLANAEAIAAIDGVGMLFFGPADYAASCGLPITAPEVRDAAAEVARIAADYGLRSGTVLFPGATVAGLAESGLGYISVAGDAGALMASLDAALTGARDEVHGAG